MEALWIWSQFPREIASDLSQYHHRRIAEWHSGDMSSYELLELLEFMPEDGAFKTAVRGGDWTHDQEVWAQIANELAILRAVQAPKVKAEEYGSRLRYSPSKLKQLVAEAEEQADVRESFYSFAARSGVQKLNTLDVDMEDDD